MEKVKVWGLEIDSCWKCYHHGRTDFDELCCSYTGTIIKSDINEDCPFSKPITKEVIEEFGFVKCDSLNGYYYKAVPEVISHSGEYFLYDSIVDTDSYELYCIDNYMFTIRNLDSEIVFIGAVNNPIELEFILKSVGVIE